MLSARTFAVLGSVAVFASLGALWVADGLSAAGWLVGLLCGLALNTVPGRWLEDGAAGHLIGPADLVTLSRAVITCVVAGLTGQALLDGPPSGRLVPLAAVALSLDVLDGWVARRTGTTSAFGSRFDGEADAFLILVLSAYLAPGFGTWVLAGGLMRYVYGAAGLLLPWLRGRLPFRYWRKVVTATQGIVLVVAAADVAPRWVSTVGLVLGLGLLSESFGRDVLWLWVRRGAGRAPAGDVVVVTGAVGPEQCSEAV